MISHTAEYALRATIHLAHQDPTRPVSVTDLARDLKLPRNYLSKILHALARAGVVESIRGPGGGFRVAAEPADITLFRIVDTFDDLTPGRTCVLGRAKCSDAHPCAVHARWKPAAEEVARFFRETTLADAAKGGA